MGYFPKETIAAVVWDEATESYPPRPDADVVRWIGPIEPTDWTGYDEWRVAGDVPSLEPSEISGLIWHIDAGTITPQADNTDLASWTSVVGPTPAQATAANQPHYRTNRVNGLPAVEFVKASDHHMDFTTLGSLSAFSIAVVWRPRASTGVQTIVTQDASGFSGDLLFGLDPEDTNTPNGKVTAVLQRSSDSTRHLATDPVTPGTTDFVIHAVRFDGSTLFDIWKNGSQVDVTTTATGATVTSRAWVLGASDNNPGQRALDAEIAEIVIYSTNISDSDLRALFSHLATKYAIEV